MKATHKKDGNLNIITRHYSYKYKEYMYLCDNWLWYFGSDLKIE
jgi:hypothetical protein